VLALLRLQRHRQVAQRAPLRLTFPPTPSGLVLGLAFLFVPYSAFAQTKPDDGAGSKPISPTASDTPRSGDTPRASERISRKPPETDRVPDQASMELSFEPAFFLGGNAPPRPGFFALFRLTGPLFGFDIGALTNVGLPGDTVEPLGSNARMIPSSRSQTGAFVFGANFIHYSIEIAHRGPSHLYFLAPEPDVRLLFSFANVPSSSPSGTSGGLVIAPGVSLVGLRFTRYIGGAWSWVSELRGPTAFAYLPVMYGGDTINPYVSLGFSIATGLAL
jgi:hypothetical protein